MEDVACMIVFTSWVGARRRYEDSVRRVANGDRTHRRRLGDFGQVLSTGVLASLDHVDFDIFAHIIVRLWSSRHCHKTVRLWL